MSTYRAYQVSGHAEFELVERPLTAPEPDQVRIRVSSCGICHSDILAVESNRAPTAAIVPGHEVIGVIDAIGDAVTAWAVGDRVGVGFLGGHCNQCTWCRRGDFTNCTAQSMPGTTIDGGYAEVIYTRSTGVVAVPETLEPTLAAPLLCAGVTTFTALRTLNAAPGALIAIHGIGGLGHLAIQYAHHLGYRVAAIARGTDKADIAKRLGADDYIDSTHTDPAAALTALGGATAILATAANGASISALITGLAPRGQLIVVGLTPDPLQIHTSALIMGGRSILGSMTGTPLDNEHCLQFSHTNTITPLVETFPFTDAPHAYARMRSGHARFRVVLTMDNPPTPDTPTEQP